VWRVKKKKKKTRRERKKRSEGYKIIGAWKGGRNGKVVYTVYLHPREEWIWMVADDRD